MKIKWGQTVGDKHLKYRDLSLNDTFRIVGSRAVYVKTRDEVVKEDRMTELATGQSFRPTVSSVERIDVEVNVAISKPSLY